MAEEYLFAPGLISPSAAKEAQNQSLLLRPLKSSDFSKGICATLAELTVVGNVTEQDFQRRFNYFKSIEDTYYIVVVEDEKQKKIAGCASVVLERKIIRELGIVAHVEDVVVRKEYRGKNLGKILVDSLMHIAHERHCYKVILDCSEDNIPFYEKCGLKRKEVQMVKYIERKKSKL